MLLVIDVGNTNIKLGIYKGEKLCQSWRLSVKVPRTADELGIEISNMFKVGGVDMKDITGVIMSSVCPPLNYTVEHACQYYIGLPAGGGTVYAAGTAPDMECRLTCTVGAAAESYLMAGILWVDVKAGDVLCLDGINRAVTCNGANALGQTDLTRWPLLAAGKNILTCPDALTVEYYPIYL